MLSKLRYFSGGPRIKLDDLSASIDPTGLLLQLGGGEVIRRVDGGTLGTSFLVQSDGRRRFLKTYTVSEGKQALDKEIAILSCLYGKSIHIERIEMSHTVAPRLWLLMDELVYPESDFGIEQILCLINGYSQKLKQCPASSYVPADDNFAHLLGEGRSALRDLASNELINDITQKKVQSCLSLLEKRIDRFPPYLCHGDFGPKNLMCDSSSPVVIDWEDAFWGIEGYDYLFWLTFFNNRKYYSQKIFGKTPWGKEIEIAILVLIIVLKSELSFRSDSCKRNKLTFDERVMEILNLE